MKIQQDIIFKYLDIIIIEAEIAEADSSKNILYEKHLKPISDSEREEYFNICEQTVSLGSKLGFMKRISKEYDWFELTEKGIQAKELGGYFKYIESIKNKELKSENKNITYNITESVIGQLNHESNFSNSPITNNTTQNPKSELKTNSITLKFWKLISENKLISSLILAVILFAIKRIFNIEL